MLRGSMRLSRFRDSGFGLGGLGLEFGDSGFW